MLPVIEIQNGTMRNAEALCTVKMVLLFAANFIAEYDIDPTDKLVLHTQLIEAIKSLNGVIEDMTGYEPLEPHEVEPL